MRKLAWNESVILGYLIQDRLRKSITWKERIRRMFEGVIKMLTGIKNIYYYPLS